MGVGNKHSQIDKYSLRFTASLILSVYLNIKEIILL